MTVSNLPTQQPFWRNIFRSASARRDLIKLLSVFFAVTGLISGVGTYFILTGLTPITPSREAIWFLFGLNVFIVTGLLGVVGGQLIRLRRQKRRGEIGAELHSRLVFLFAVIASLPAIFVASFAIVTLDRGLDSWFSDRTKAIISNTTAVANAYLSEHRNTLRRDVVAIARDLSRSAEVMQKEERRFEMLLNAQAALRSIPSLVIIDDDRNLRFSATRASEMKLVTPPEEVMELAQSGKPIIITVAALAQVQVLQKIEGITPNLYILATRFVAPNVLEHLARTNDAVKEYSEMEGRRFEAQLTFAMLYIVIALVILLSAIWLGLWLADRLAEPISDLMRASEQVGNGDLSVRVAARRDDEMGRLGLGFNEMIHRLDRQQKQIIGARDNLDERNRFMKMVLNSVSAAIIGIDENGKINHANKAARTLAGRPSAQLIGASLGECFPEISSLISTESKKGQSISQLSRLGVDGSEQILRVAVARNVVAHGTNMVISIDDVTDLISAQRVSAWADIARRIAHEIKNPLTPIQLSAERLKRKYKYQISQDIETFETCTDTIIRQVGDIERMVDEFSSFARMPRAVMRRFDLCDVISRALFLQRVAHPDVSFNFDHPGLMMIEADDRLLSQALTNLLKNSVEAIRSAGEAGLEGAAITVALQNTDTGLVNISISDNGPGWPAGDRTSLLEPYNTSRIGGTGLGLAIVKKIMDDHGGRITFCDALGPDGQKQGAQIILELPESHHVDPNKTKVESYVS